MVFVEVLLVVAPGPSEEAFPAAAAGAGAFPVEVRLVAAAAEEAFLAEGLPSAAAAAAAAALPCRAAGRTLLVLLRGRAPSLMLGACRARLVPSRAPAVYSGGGGARTAARELRWRLRVCASRRFTGRPDHLSFARRRGASASRRGKLARQRRLRAVFEALTAPHGRQAGSRV